MPPIYQPGVAAEAIYWAAHHNRREIYVGRSTVIVVISNKLAPGLADWYLAKTGYQSQQTGEPRDPDQPFNLWKPVDDATDYGAHGTFDSRATAWSPQLWATTCDAWSLAIGAGLATVGALLLRRNQ